MAERTAELSRAKGAAQEAQALFRRPCVLPCQDGVDLFPAPQPPVSADAGAVDVDAAADEFPVKTDQIAQADS